MAIGKACSSPFCMNSSHFLSLGVIPELESPTYAELRNREEAGWYSEEMNSFLSNKLGYSNDCYNTIQKLKSDYIGIIDRTLGWSLKAVRKIKDVVKKV